MKETWSHINNVLGNRKRNVMPNQMFLNDHEFTSKHDIVNQFNSYFFSVGKNCKTQYQSQHNHLKVLYLIR